MFATPFAAESLSVRLSCACGFALFPLSASEQDELVRQADAALYRVKASGRASTAELDARTGAAATEKALPRTIAQIGPLRANRRFRDGLGGSRPLARLSDERERAR